MKKIKNPDEYLVVEFDGVEKATVYIGGFDRLQPTILLWRKEEVEGFGEWLCLSLEEIKKQLIGESRGRHLITIFIEGPLAGHILQYGNYGDEWWEIGTTGGYA